MEQDNAKSEQKSEFGRGLVICLVKFSEHLYKMNDLLKNYKELSSRNASLFKPGEVESDALQMYFNGASDHFREIEVPDKWKYTPLGIKVVKLREKSLAIGYRYRNVQEWTMEDFGEMHSLCREIAVLIDKELGLNADEGQW